MAARRRDGRVAVGAERLAEIIEGVAAERRPDRLAPIALDAALAVTGARCGRLVGPAGPLGRRPLAVEGTPPERTAPLTVELPGTAGPLGWIEVWGAGDDPASEAALRLVALQCARGLENERLRRERGDDRRRAERLAAAVDALRRAEDPRDAVDVALAEARGLLGAPASALIVGAGGRLEVAAVEGIDGEGSPEVSALVPPELREEIAGGGPWSGVLAPDQPLRRLGMASAALVGVGPEASFGFLAVLDDREEPPHADAVRSLERFAGHLADALTTAVLQQEMRGMGTLDPLTRLFNGRYLAGRIHQECQRALRAGAELSLARLELDGLRELRAEGRERQADAAVEALAGHVAAGLRGMDVACRAGDDELAAILPDVSGIDALRVGERLRASIAGDPALAGFTLSVGVAGFPDQPTAELLMDDARSALDWARRDGGGRTFLFHGDAAEILRAEERDADLPADPESLVATLAALAAAVDARHPRTIAHAENTARICALIAAELGLGQAAVEDVRIAGLLHDLGKIGVREEIVGRPDPLSRAEADELRRHPEIGERMLSGSRLAPLRPWVRHHHERMDGAGHPDALSGPDIPFEARIVSAASAFEHLLSGDATSGALPAVEAIRALEARAGGELDPVVVAALRALVGRGTSGVIPAGG